MIIGVGQREFQATLITPSSICNISLEERVNMVAAKIKKREIVMLTWTVEEFLREDPIHCGAEKRKHIIETAQEVESEIRRISTDRGVNVEHRISIQESQNLKEAPFVWSILANSIENVTILELINEGKNIFDGVPKKYIVGFFHNIVFDYIDNLMDIASMNLRGCKSTNWKKTFIDVHELPKKHEKNSIESDDSWRMQEIMYQNEQARSEPERALKRLIMKKLGVDFDSQAFDIYKQISNNYKMNRERAFDVGYYMGVTHENGLIPTDMKMEHVLYNPNEEQFRRAVFVDHDHDVALLRSATPAECASSLAVLYQQFDRSQWKAFKEGYVTSRMVAACDVLFLFDGERVLEELGSYLVQSARPIRNEGKYEIALEQYDVAVEIFRKWEMSGSADAHAKVLHVYLIKGDTLMEADRFAEARSIYEKGIAEFRRLVNEGQRQFRILLGSGVMNLGCTLLEMGLRKEAVECFNEVMDIGAMLEKDGDERSRYLIEGASKNLSTLKGGEQT